MSRREDDCPGASSSKIRKQGLLVGIRLDWICCGLAMHRPAPRCTANQTASAAPTATEPISRRCQRLRLRSGTVAATGSRCCLRPLAAE
jgi:hypothetical protein